MITSHHIYIQLNIILYCELEFFPPLYILTRTLNPLTINVTVIGYTLLFISSYSISHPKKAVYPFSCKPLPDK